MRVTLTASCLWAFLSVGWCQVSLPNPQYLPPDADAGAVKSNESSPNPQWSTLLGNLLYFYDAQRSGNLSSTNRVDWRNSSCEDDGEDVNLDLSGGYYDAGNFIKATYPLSFSLMSICWGAMDVGEGYDLANQTPYLDSMLRWGLNWLIKAHPSSNTLYVLVSESDDDGSYWGGDRDIPTPRSSFQINSTNPGTDAAAAASSAFSACSALYANHTFFNTSYFTPPASLQDNTYASTLLQHATQLYDFAVNAEGGLANYQDSVPAAEDSYASSSYGDELTLAALFLAIATAQNGSDSSAAKSYYQDAKGYYDQYSLGGQDAVYNWDSKTPGVYVLFAQAALSNNDLGGDDLSKWRDAAEKYFDGVVNEDRGYLTGGGLLWYDGDSDSASLNPALNAAMLLSRYAPMSSSDDKRQTYQDFAKSQVDYALGDNPMHVPYVVGSNPNSPSNPHSAMASGGNNIAEIDTVPAEMAHVLYGAVIGGPDKRGRYHDIRSDWVESEVALDYNAPMLTLAAMHVKNDNTDPFFTSLAAGEYDKVRPKSRPCDQAIQDGCAGPQLPLVGKIVMGVVLGVVGLILVGLLGTYIMAIRKNGKTE